jgi:hypothetical protein
MCAGLICALKKLKRSYSSFTVAFTADGTWEIFMLGFSRRQLLKGLAAVVGIVSIISLALIYFIPAPPSTVTMATAFKGSSFEYYGRRYREIFARSHIQLELRETDGAVENVKLLQDPKSGVQIAFAFGGISGGEPAPGVLPRNRVQQPILDLLFFRRIA